MPTIEASPTTAEAPRADAQSHPTCAVCPLAWDAHDSIGIRYCSASIAGGLHRGCVCVNESTTTT